MKNIIAKFVNKENGNASLVTLLMLMPVLILFFGLGIDAAKGNYARQSVDNNLQSALVAGASQLRPNMNRIDPILSRQLAIKQYTDNRVNYGKTLRCATSADLEAGESLQGGSCKWILSSWSVAPDQKSITMEVREFTPNLWLRVGDLKEFTIRVNASASIGYN